MITFIKNILSYFGVGIHPRQRKRLFSGTGIHDISIGKFTLKADKNHSLPYNIKHYPDYNKNIGRIAAFLYQRYPDTIVLDIGANVGDTVFFIKNEADPEIICIEGDEYYFGLLQSNISQFKNVSAFHYLLGDQEQTSSFSLKKEHGTATIELSENAGKQVSMISLDKFIVERIASPEKIRLLKIDTDGYDVKIIRGAFNALKAYKPVLFFEYDTEFMRKAGEKGLDTLDQLSKLGYDDILFYDNYGRFMLSAHIGDQTTIEQLHNYVNHYVAPFPFFDICIFHSEQAGFAKEFIRLESIHVSQTMQGR